MSLILGSGHSTSRPIELTPQEVHQWGEDLNFLKRTLESRHFNLYHTLPAEKFEQELDRISQSLPDMNRYQLQAEVMTLVQSIGDGHTMVHGWQGPARVLPLRFLNIEGQWRVIKASQAYKYLLGNTLVEIEGHPIEEVAKWIGNASPTQSESTAARVYATARNLPLASLLYGLGLTQSPEQATMKFRDNYGGLVEASLPSYSLDHSPDLHGLIVTQKPDSGSEIETDGILFYPLDGNTGYLDWNGYPGEFSAVRFAYRLNKYIEKHKTRNLIIDLRNNGGGNFFIGLLIAQFLIVVDHLDWQDGIYVLTNAGTFSAAASNAIQFRQMFNARIVGEAAGGNPHGIQDADTFTLPHSGWEVMYSKRKFRFTTEVTDGLQPDVLVPTTWQGLQEGKDEVLDWVLGDIRARHGD